MATQYIPPPGYLPWPKRLKPLECPNCRDKNAGFVWFPREHRDMAVNGKCLKCGAQLWHDWDKGGCNYYYKPNQGQLTLDL